MEMPGSSLKIVSSIGCLWRHISQKRKRQLLILLAIMVLASCAEVFSIGATIPFLTALAAPSQLLANPVVRDILHHFGVTESRDVLLFLTIIFIAAAFVSGAMRLALLLMQTRIGYAIGADFSFEIYKKTLYQPYVVHIKRNSSEVISGILSKTGAVIGNILLPLLAFIGSLFILMSILATLIFIDPLVALSAFGGFGILYFAIMLATKKRLVLDSQLISVEYNQVIKALQEGLGGIRDVLIEGTQEIYSKIYQDADIKLRKSQANIQIISGAPRFIIESLGMGLIALLSYALAIEDSGAASAIPLLGALAVGAQRLLPIMQQLYSSWTNIRGGQISLQDVIELLDQPMPEYTYQPVLHEISFKDSIVIDNLSFRYSKIGPSVLSDIRLEIPKGSRIGFIGSTGGGKSTLLDIIMGLLQPTRGMISVDGKPITVQNSRAWQRKIAHVPQTIFLADSTIAENIAFGVPLGNIDKIRLQMAARQAQIANTIESWADGYDTFVGERGIRLSGGQRQRIGIARAFYKNASVIVFDEATSALDNDTELAVMEAIEKIGEEATVLMVAQRLTTLKGCELIVELLDGRISRIGTYEEIVKQE